jgi:hypothetical protein
MRPSNGYVVFGDDDSGDVDYPVDIRDKIVEKAISSLYGEGEYSDRPKVIPIVPDLHAGRMLQQGSSFTLHMALDEIKQGGGWPTVVPKEYKPRLQDELRMLGVTQASLFPGLGSLSLDIRDELQRYRRVC